jgi:hypothetical protein
VKLAIDCLIISPCETDDDLFETLKTFETDWFIGHENDPEYILNIQNCKPYIFTLFDDTGKVSGTIYLYLNHNFNFFVIISENCK